MSEQDDLLPTPDILREFESCVDDPGRQFSNVFCELFRDLVVAKCGFDLTVQGWIRHNACPIDADDNGEGLTGFEQISSLIWPVEFKKKNSKKLKSLEILVSNSQCFTRPGNEKLGQAAGQQTCWPPSSMRRTPPLTLHHKGQERSVKFVHSFR